ncbi:MAG: perosamine synthetase [Thermoleophilaceae bacterium]|nr:perosamine synthetase [Thermoleophilaceae bacterium]
MTSGASDDGRIPLSVPTLAGNELAYLSECVAENWVAASGRFVGEFERGFADYHGADDALSAQSGTAALHVAMTALGIGPGDEVIVPSLTFVATANPVRYVGATPVFADVDPLTYGLDVESVRGLVNGRTRAIVPVHLYGHPVDMDPLLEVARAAGAYVIEDATEALGSRYRGRLCGTLGDVGCFSFNGNKVITTGGGGMVLARDPELLRRMRKLTLQGRVPGREYVHDEVGFNYTLSNVQAAIGVAQLERLDQLVAARRAVAARYAEALAGVPGLTYCREAEWAWSNFWLGSVLVDPDAYGEDRDELMDRLGAAGIEARPFFHPIHRLEPFAVQGGGPLPVAERLHATGVSIPSSASLAPDAQDRVIDALARR